MSIPRQITLSVLVLIVAAAGWLLYERRDLIFSSAGASVAPSGAASNSPGGHSAGADSGTPGARASGGGGGARAPGGGGRPGGGATMVVAAKVGIDSTGIDVRAIGTADAARSVTVYPQVTGIISEIEFTPGTKVAAGDTLVKLDDADQRVAVDRATVALDKAKEAVARAERLQKSGNVSAVTLSDAQTDVQTAQIDLRSAQLELAKRTITAPFAGTVGLTNLAIGDLVSTSKEITTIDDMSTVTVDFEVPERVAGQMAVGLPVTGTAAALPGETMAGTITAVDSRIGADTRTLKLEATLPNEAAMLKPGMAVTISLSIAGEPRPTVPSLAIQWDRQGSFVWKLDGDKAVRTPVQVVDRQSGSVSVAGGLAENDEVVVEGALKLRPGATVARVDQNGDPIAKPGAPATPPAKTPGDGVPEAGATPKARNG